LAALTQWAITVAFVRTSDAATSETADTATALAMSVDLRVLESSILKLGIDLNYAVAVCFSMND
jgi:hypothetical protein